MKKMLKLFVVLLVILAIAFVGAYIFILTKGKDLVIAQIEKKVDRKAYLQEMSFGLPAVVRIKNLEIENLIETEDLYVSVSLLGFFTGKIVLDEVRLVEPHIMLERSQDGSFVIPLKKEEGLSRKIMPVLLGLSLRDGSVEFIDRKVDPAGFKTKIEDLDLNVRQRISTRFNIKAKILGRTDYPHATLNGKGWINLDRKDMQADLELSNLDLVYFLPYYKRFAGQSNLKTANFSSKTNLKAKDNQIQGNCHVEIKDIAYEEPSQEEMEATTIEPLSAVLGAVTKGADQVVIDLPIKGTLIPFKINRAEIAGAIFKEMFKSVVAEQTEKVQEEIGKQFKDLGEEIKDKFIESIFKPKQE